MTIAPPRAGTGWRKSSRSGGADNCVEVAEEFAGPVRVGVRDSKDVAGPALVFPRGPWRTFVSAVKSGTLG